MKSSQHLRLFKGSARRELNRSPDETHGCGSWLMESRNGRQTSKPLMGRENDDEQLQN